MLDEREKKALRTGVFELHCPSMTLAHNAADDSRRRYRGVGSIRQTAGKGLLFVFHPTGEHQTVSNELFGTLSPLRSWPSGCLLPDDQYYSLEATDCLGRKWVNRRVIPESRIGGADAFVVTGELTGLSATHDTGSSGRHDSLAFSVLGDIDLPMNNWTETQVVVADTKKQSCRRLNAARFQACGYTLLITKDGDLVTIDVVSDGKPFPCHIESRILQALQFVLAQPLNWFAMEKQVGGIESVSIQVPDTQASKPRLRPPIALWGRDPEGSVWKLLEQFLRHTIGYEEEDWHPLEGWLHFVLEASRESINSLALALSVSVEGVLGAEFGCFGAPSEVLIQAVGEATRDMDKWIKDGRLRDRLKGLLRDVLRPSPMDKLWQLVAEGATSAQLCNAWHELRNGAVHAGRPYSLPYQRLYDLCHCVTVLLYHLVFRAIEYNGEYTDYSTHSWPTREYPPHVEKAVSAADVSGDPPDKGRNDCGEAAGS